MHFTHRYNHAIEFSADASLLGGTYRFEPGLPKPCFHPLRTASGHTLTGFQMSDHHWHRGLWFTIKFINGVNFWEETPGEEFGVQLSDSEPLPILSDENTLTIDHVLRWRAPSLGDVLHETRRLIIEIGDSGILTLHWHSALEALADLTFDRTPFTTWGGYSGFTFRGGRTLHNSHVRLPDGSTETVLVAKPADHIVLEGSLDGAPGQRASVALFSHPDNPRAPANPPGPPLWYGKATPDYVFLNDAFLFHGPMNVARGTVLHFRNRCVVSNQ